MGRQAVGRGGGLGHLAPGGRDATLQGQAVPPGRGGLRGQLGGLPSELAGSASPPRPGPDHLAGSPGSGLPPASTGSASCGSSTGAGGSGMATASASALACWALAWAAAACAAAVTWHRRCLHHPAAAGAAGAGAATGSGGAAAASLVAWWPGRGLRSRGRHLLRLTDRAAELAPRRRLLRRIGRRRLVLVLRALRRRLLGLLLHRGRTRLDLRLLTGVELALQDGPVGDRAHLRATSDQSARRAVAGRPLQCEQPGRPRRSRSGPLRCGPRGRRLSLTPNRRRWLLVRHSLDGLPASTADPIIGVP